MRVSPLAGRVDERMGTGFDRIPDNRARATDSAGDAQPETVEEVWNFLGYANTAWHRVNVRTEALMILVTTEGLPAHAP